MRLGRIAFVVAVMSFTTLAFAQESEFQTKIQEDMDGYKSRFTNNCGTPASLTFKYAGKLGANPRSSAKPEWNAVTTLCTTGLSVVSDDGCQNNKVIKQAIGKVTSVTCTAGKGTLDYSLKGTALTIKLDPSFTTNNASGQGADLLAKMKSDLDK